MIVGRYTQQPNERLIRRVDYSYWLQTGETLNTVDAAAVKHSGTVDDSGDPFTVESAVVAEDVYIDYITSGGASGNTYKITFNVVTTPIAQEKEVEVLVRVKEV